jgi:OFA family oxalate/formate antiporter-like MFS transporter
MLVPFLLLFGIGYGGVISLRPALVRDYFGRRSFGTIFGLMTGIGGIGGIVGPTLAGWVFDTWQTYQVIWLVFGIAAILPLGLVLKTGPVRG